MDASKLVTQATGSHSETVKLHSLVLCKVLTRILIVLCMFTFLIRLQVLEGGSLMYELSWNMALNIWK